METKLMKTIVKSTVLAAALFGIFGMMVATATTANAGVTTVTEIIAPTVEEPTSTGGGSSGSGGGGSIGDLPSYFRDGRISQEIDFIPGMRFSIDAQNNPGGTDIWVDGNGQEHVDVYGPSCNGSLQVWIEQGAEGTDFLPLRPQTEIRRYKDDGRFQVKFEYTFLFLEEVNDWTAPPSGGMYWSDPFRKDLRFDTHISLDHEKNWDWPNGWEEEPVVTTTQNIDGYASFWFNQTKVTNAHLDVDDYTSKHYHGDDTPPDVFYGMTVEGRFDLEWIGDAAGLAAFNDMIPLSASPAPEPATMSLLALGGLGLLRRRRRS
jgi:hypothetical protein